MRTIRTRDHGDVTITCPPWCIADHPDDGHRADITHEGRPIVLDVPTRFGGAEILGCSLAQAPYTELPDPGPAVYVVVDLGGDWQAFGPAELEQLADGLMTHALRIRGLAARLRLIREVRP